MNGDGIIAYIVEQQYRNRYTNERIEIVDWENIRSKLPKIVLE